MPKQEHEMLIRLFRNEPSLAAALLQEALGIDIPPFNEASIESGELTDCEPTEYRADAVVTLKDEHPAMAIVVEIQRAPDKGKRWSWPVYLATLRARWKCPVVLLVLCPDDRTAEWCAQPIDMGHPGWVLIPLAVGPKVLPAITDPEQAVREPELSVLSALAHGTEPGVLNALHTAMQTIDSERAELYTDYVLAALPAAARKHWEELMSAGTYEYQSDFAKRYAARGKEEGLAEATANSVITFLTARGIEVPESARERITGCTDLDQLETWVQWAAVIDTIDELFD